MDRLVSVCRGLMRGMAVIVVGLLLAVGAAGCSNEPDYAAVIPVERGDRSNSEVRTLVAGIIADIADDMDLDSGSYYVEAQDSERQHFFQFVDPDISGGVNVRLEMNEQDEWEVLLELSTPRHTSENTALYERVEATFRERLVNTFGA